MAPLPAVAKVIKHLLVYTVGSDTNCMNRTYWRYTGVAPTAVELSTWAFATCDIWAAHNAQLCPATVILTQAHATDLSTPSSADAVAAVSHAGTRVGGPLPANVAVLVDYHINRRYRGGKPRRSRTPRSRARPPSAPPPCSASTCGSCSSCRTPPCRREGA